VEKTNGTNKELQNFMGGSPTAPGEKQTRTKNYIKNPGGEANQGVALDHEGGCTRGKNTLKATGKPHGFWGGIKGERKANHPAMPKSKTREP